MPITRDTVLEALRSVPMPGTDGRIVFKGGIGPWGFKPAVTRAALVQALGK